MSVIDIKKSKKRKLGNDTEESNKKSKMRSKGSIVIEEETDELAKESSPKLCSEDEDPDPTNLKENLNGELIGIQWVYM